MNQSLILSMLNISVKYRAETFTVELKGILRVLWIV